MGVTSIYYRGTPIAAVYLRGQKTWPSQEQPILEILSCFYNGYWIDEYPWTDNTPWTD